MMRQNDAFAALVARFENEAVLARKGADHAASRGNTEHQIRSETEARTWQKAAEIARAAAKDAEGAGR